MKINNPYSKNRYTVKEKIKRKFMKLLLTLIKRIPISDEVQFDSKPKYIPNSIFRIRQHMVHREKNTSLNSKPSYIDIDLLSVQISEYVPIENIDNLEKGLLKILKKYNTASYYYNSFSEVKKFFNEVRKNTNRNICIRIANIIIDRDSKLYNYVKNIEIDITQISSSSIIIIFNILPSENFFVFCRSEINKNMNMEEKIIFHSNIKKLAQPSQEVFQAKPLKKKK